MGVTGSTSVVWAMNSIYLEEGDPERTVSVLGRAYFHIEYDYP